MNGVAEKENQEFNHSHSAYGLVTILTDLPQVYILILYIHGSHICDTAQTDHLCSIKYHNARVL